MLWYDLGTALLMTDSKDWTGSHAAFREAVEVDPEYSDAWPQFVETGFHDNEERYLNASDLAILKSTKNLFSDWVVAYTESSWAGNNPWMSFIPQSAGIAMLLFGRTADFNDSSNSERWKRFRLLGAILLAADRHWRRDGRQSEDQEDQISGPDA